jgi:hypothetical protein
LQYAPNKIIINGYTDEQIGHDIFIMIDRGLLEGKVLVYHICIVLVLKLGQRGLLSKDMNLLTLQDQSLFGRK